MRVFSEPRFEPLPVTAPLGAVADRLTAAEVTGMGGGGYPTARKLTAAWRWQETQSSATPGIRLFANGVACEPGIDGDLLALADHGDEVMLGLARLAQALQVAAPCLVLGHRTKAQAGALQARWDQLAREAAPPLPPLRVLAVPDAPAAGAEPMVLQAAGCVLANLANPPATQGVVVLNVITLMAAGRALAHGEVMTGRPVTVAGQTRWQAFGQPLAALVPDAAPLRSGGPWSGREAQAEERTDRTTLAVAPLAASRNDPCIGCARCAPACPAGIDPEALWHASSTLPRTPPTLAEAQQPDSAIARLASAGLDACIECGYCNVVCPSGIDLLQGFRTAKRRQAAVLALTQNADRSAARFRRHEARQVARATARADRRSARLAQRRSWDTDR